MGNMKITNYAVFLSLMLLPLITPSPLESTNGDTSEEAPKSLLMMKNIRSVAESISKTYKNANEEANITLTLKKITSELNSLLNDLNKTGINLYRNSDVYAISIPKDIQTVGRINDNLKDLFDTIIDINYLYESYYLEYLNGQISNTSLQIFISKAIGADIDSPGKSAFKIHKMVCPEVFGIQNSNLLNRIVIQLNTEGNLFCETGQSSQQFIHNLHHFITTVELKAFIMITSAYKLRSLTSNDDYARDLDRAKNEYLRRMQNYLTGLREVLDKASNEISACHPVIQYDYDVNLVKAINKLPKESDHKNNMVVTGIRFVIKNAILHLQIEEGKLIADGQILPGSERWIPTDDMDYNTHTINRDGQITGMRQCLEYHSIGSMDYLHLTNVTVPSDSVITGVNFEVFISEKSESKILYFRLKYAKVNFTTAQIYPDNGKYSDVLTDNTSELLSSSDLDLDDEYIHFIKKEGNSYDYYSNNRQSNQKILSHIDSQAIHANPRLPLTGIGFYQNHDSSGDHSVSLKIFSLDFSTFIDTN